MKLPTILIITLATFICITAVLLVKLIIYKTIISKITSDNANEKHFCNYCKNGYILTKKDRELTHCKDCGRPLTLHKKHPDFIEDFNKIIQSDSPFEDFNKKEQ